jgi:CelD/BcsL family acetyltransferase involved in cellulose biosynthesis
VAIYDGAPRTGGKALMTEVVELNSIEDLDRYHLVWNSLLQLTPGGNFFQSLDWLKAYWQHYGHGQKLRVLVVKSRGNAIGIVPLCVRGEKTRVGAVRVLTYPLQDWGTYYGPIGPNPTATLVTALGHVRRTRRDWDMLDLRFVDRGRDRGRTPLAMAMSGFPAREAMWKETALVELAGSWDEYFATRTTKFRNNVRRYERRLAELGSVEYVRYRPLGALGGEGDPRWGLYDECIELAEKSWQGSSANGTTLSHPSVRDFFRQTHGLAAKLGMLDLNLLRIDGRAIAFAYNYHWDGHVLGVRVGYDPEFKNAGAGKALYAMLIRDGYARGDRVFEMGIGSMDIKTEWMTRTVHSYRYSHYPLSAPKAQALRLKHWWLSRRATTETVATANA